MKSHVGCVTLSGLLESSQFELAHLSKKDNGSPHL